MGAAPGAPLQLRALPGEGACGERGLSTPGVEELGDGLLLPSGGLVVWVVGTAVVKKRNLDLCHFFDP